MEGPNIPFTYQIEGIISSGHDEKQFFQLVKTLWNASMGDPHSPDPEHRVKYNGKLQGVLSWPFSLELPPQVAIEEKVARTFNLNPVERLPPSLAGQGWHPTINYRIVVNVRRHGILRPDSSYVKLHFPGNTF